MSPVAVATPPTTNGHGDPEILPDETSKLPKEARFATGLILPPPEIKSVIDRTAGFVARSANPLQFEEKIREGHRQEAKFSFLNPTDSYHGYYRYRMEKIAAGEEDEVVAVQDGEKMEIAMDVDEKVTPVGVLPKEPPPSDFIIDLTQLRAIDLDIIKLTALFTARRGLGFLGTLSNREGRNPEFDFLRPTHSYFGYFNALVEQYSKVLQPSQEMLTKLKEEAEENAKWKKLDVIKQYSEWERAKRERERKKQDDKEAEKRAFAEIDWHDYAIVQTIEFTAADAHAELPPPMSVTEMESLTLAQKKMAALVMENTAEDVEAHRARQAAAEAEVAAVAGGVGKGFGEDGAMEGSDDENDQVRKRAEDDEKRKVQERARALQASSMEPAVPMKIRTDYVPKLGAKNASAAMTTCRVCGQQVPVDELEEHTRIELLDPKWKSQRDMIESRRAQQSELQRGADVGSSLKSLARARGDIFGTEADEERRKKEEQEMSARRKEREKVVWDGHTASKDRTLDKFQTNVNFEEQIAAIHRAKGLGPVDNAALGPGIGPSLTPTPTSLPPPPPSLPAPPHQSSTASGAPDGGAYSAATVSAGPQPPSLYPNASAPVMLPPLHYQGLDAAQPFGYQPPVPGMHPARMAALGPMQPGMVRTADQMEGNDDTPPAKRQRVARLPNGQYYPEQDWVSLHPHPISLQIHLPVDPSKPEWKLDGSVVTVPDIPVTYMVSTVRDHIIRQIGSSVPLSRIILSYGGKMLTNSNTIASYNIEDEDLLTLTVREVKKKK